MKLVEILARDLKEWPCSSGAFIYITESGMVWDSEGETHGQILYEGEYEYESVTRAQWEAKRARIATADAMEESKKIIESSSARFSSAEEMLCSFDAESVAEDWRNECQKQHEQELWDKVASEIFIRACDESIARFKSDEIEYVAGRSALYADAFIAERAKRMKG